MQNTYLKYLLLFGFLLGTFLGKAQEPMSLYYLENIPQSNLLNPAMTPRCNIYVGIPVINAINFGLNMNFSQQNLLQNTTSGTVSLLNKEFDYSKLFNEVGDHIYSNINYSMGLISFGFRTKNGYATFGISTKIQSNTFLSTDIFKITDKGFPDGSKFDFEGTGTNLDVYQEYAIGYTHNVTKKLKVGARVKLLQGIFSTKTDLSEFSLKTGADEWNIGVKGDIYTSLPIEMTENEDGSLSFDSKITDSTDVSEYIDYATNFSNLGFGLDIGASYDLNYAWSFSASLVDFGFIRWKDNLNSIHANGDFAFSGLDLDGTSINDTDPVIEELTDSLKNAIDYHGEHQAFGSRTTSMFHLGAKYNVNHYFSAGLLSRTAFNKNYLRQDFNLSANLNTFRGIVSTSLNYNFSFTNEHYAGLGLSIRLLPLQFYLLIDHIPLVYTNYVIKENANDSGQSIPAPYNLKAANFMFGLNLILGAHGFKDSPKIDAYSEF